jgi:hypothetical protein
MSGARRTEDLNSVKTRQLILINPDGSSPAQGQFIGVTDSRGTLGPLPNPVFDTITANNINVTNYPAYQDISAITIQADNITTNTLDIINNGQLTVYDLCANRIETVYLTATDICAGCITVNTIYPQQIGSDATPVIVGNFVQVNALDINASVSITTPELTVSSNIYAQDICATWLDTQTITTTDLATNTISRAETINTIVLNAGTAEIGDLTVTELANISNLVSTDISATNINAVNATVTGVLNSSGTFNPTNINTAGTIQAGRIVAINDISAGSIYARNANFDRLNATVIDLSGINYPSLSANVFTGGQVNVTGKLTVTGSTELNDVSASSLIVSRGTTLNTVTAAQITAPIISATSSLNVGTSGGTSELTMVDTTKPISQLLPNPGVITYDVSRGLLLNGLLVSTTAAFGQTQPFSLVTATNNLETVADLTATMFDLLNSYNAFLTIFSNAKLIIQLTPVVNFLSSYSIQFVINNVAQPPLILSGKYALGSTNVGATTLMSLLTASAQNAIQFTSSPDANNIWNVRIDVVGTNNYISDVSGMPTGSLQVLRTLGFNVPIESNPYETYALPPGGSTYVRTAYDLSSGYFAEGAILPQLVQYANNLPDVSYNVTPDPYSFPITFIDLSNNPSVLYLAIKYNSSYNLYPKTNPLVTFSELAPNTGYNFIFNYLDLSNNSSASPTLTTTRIPAPTDVSANSSDITFNSFTLRWTQPYPGRTYTFNIDASGQFIITSPVIGVSPPVTFSPLVQNAQYRISVTSFDASFNSYSDPTPTIVVTTNPLTVPTPVISAPPNSNISALINWTTPVTAGASGILNYYVNRGALRVYNIPGATTSFTINDLSGTGDICGSLVYTDNNYNTITGALATYHYDTSFGYYNMPPIDISSQGISLNNTTLYGIGYVFPATVPGPIPNPWIGYSFNRITFPMGLRVTTAVTVSFRANIYIVNPISQIASLYTAPSFIVASFTLPAVDTSSNTVVLDASSTPYMRYPTLTFGTTVVLSQNTMVLFQIVSGAATIQFGTFSFSGGITNYATSVAYRTSDPMLSNWSAAVFKSVICQFSYV